MNIVPKCLNLMLLQMTKLFHVIQHVYVLVLMFQLLIHRNAFQLHVPKNIQYNQNIEAIE